MMWSRGGAKVRVRRRTNLAAQIPMTRKYCQALALGVIAVLVGSACRGTNASTPPSPTPRWPPEEHCWWAAYRATMPPDSVVTRVAAALESIGFEHGRTNHLGDTAWTQAGPTALSGPRAGNYAARAVAIRMGDSTHVRVFVGADAIAAKGVIPMCGEILSRAALHAAAPRREEPDDSAPRWRRRP